MAASAGKKCPMVILAGNSHPELAQLIASRMGIRLGDMTVYHKSNRETNVEIKESVRGKDVYIIQTGTKDVNNDVMELLIISYACKTSCASTIVGVVPYIPYSKQSKMRKRGSVVCKLMATMFGKAGLTHIITMDLHQKEIQGFFDIPVENLRASPFLIDYIEQSIPDYRNAIIVARNPNSVKRATSYAERLHLGIAVIHGDDKITETDSEDGRNSPPLQRQAHHKMEFGLEILPVLLPKEKPPLNVVGDVGGRIAIIVDDMIDDVKSYVNIAEVLKDRGAYKVYVMATHGLLSSDAPRLLDDSCIDETGKGVPVILPQDTKKALQFLTDPENRTKVGVPSGNPYVFGSTGAGVYRAYDAIRTVASDADLQHPNLIRTSNMRKYMATMLQVVVTNTVPHEVQKMQCHKIRTVDISVMLVEAIRRIHNNESMSYLFRNIGMED